MIEKKSKKGQILAENVIFIILNIVFLSILILFIVSKTGSTAVLEDKYSKQIALMIDSAKPGMIIHLNMEDAISAAQGSGVDNLLNISGNDVTVKLHNPGGTSYSFFNNVNVSAFPDTSSNPVKEYILIVNKYN